MCNVHISGTGGRTDFSQKPRVSFVFRRFDSLAAKKWLLVHRPSDREHVILNKSRVVHVWQVLSCMCDGCGLAREDGKLLTVHVPVHVHFYGGWLAGPLSAYFSRSTMKSFLRGFLLV